MESSTLSGINDQTVDRTAVGAISVIAPSVASPIAAAIRLCLDARPDLVVRSRTAPAMDTRSQGGVGSYRVEGMWRLDDRGDDLLDDDQNQKFSTHKFSTRQGPPTCSPPV